MKQILVYFVGLCLSMTTFAQEICDNGIDDNGNGLIDLNDSDCLCNSSGSGNPSSLIPNPSFEDMVCCPNDYSQVSCASQWVQASEATSDYLHVCDFISSFGSTTAVPFPDGNGAVGFYALNNYNESIGTCLSSPMVAGTQYTLQMQVAYLGILPTTGEPCNYTAPATNLDLFIFGNPNCGNFPLPGYLCPMASPTGYVVLDSAPLSTQTSTYQTLTFTFTPAVTINEIIIGPPCDYPIGWIDFLTIDFLQCLPYLIADNLILNTSSSFGALTISQQGTLCSNDLVLSVTVSEPGGTLQWYQEGIALVGQTSNSLEVSTLGLGNGTYQATYTLNGNCSMDTVVISGSSNPITVTNAEICPGDSAELIASGGINYTWSPASGLSSTTGPNVIASPNQTTNYTVTSTNANGCISEAVSTVTVIASPTIVINVSPYPVETEATLTANPPQFDYSWTTPEGEQIIGNPITYPFPEGATGNYSFTVQTENQFGCLLSQTIQIAINQDVLVYVPNSFTPDFNEFNNTFFPVISDGFDSQAYALTIYDRWGEVVFDSNDISVGWDGTYNGRIVQTGVYTWSLKLKLMINDDIKVYTGHVNVLR